MFVIVAEYSNIIYTYCWGGGLFLLAAWLVYFFLPLLLPLIICTINVRAYGANQGHVDVHGLLAHVYVHENAICFLRFPHHYENGNDVHRHVDDSVSVPLQYVYADVYEIKYW